MFNSPAETFNQFLNALESDNAQALDSVFGVDATVRTSFLGNADGIEEIKNLFTWQGMESQKKFRVFNDVIRVFEGSAFQSVYLLPLFVTEIDGFSYIMQSAFLTCVQYSKGTNGWEIVSLKANLTFESGNSLIVAGWWKLIDYGKMFGNDLNLIDTEADAPWKALPEASLSDEDAIKECFYRYCWDIDTNGFLDMQNIATLEADISGTGSKDRIDWMESLQNKRLRVTNFNGKVYPREACWNHIVTFRSIQVSGSKATAKIYRNEPNRIGTRFLHKYNLNYLYYSSGWVIEFEKGEDDMWRFSKINYLSGIFADNENAGRRYF